MGSGNGQCDPEVLRMYGDFWTLRIVDYLENAHGAQRFSSIERALEVSPTVLTARLARMEEKSLVERAEGTASKTSVTYALTARGVRVTGIIRAIAAVDAD